QGLISKEEYKENINEIIAFLKGKKRGHILELQKQMREYSINEEFEKAAKLRDKIDDLKYLGESIDFEIDDTEESYTERRKKLLLKNFTQLKEELKISELSRIECYDISNIQGKEAYGSLVVAENGEIVRNKYRIFKIKSLDTPNDMHMLKEVIARRFDNRNASKYEKNPEVVLIDGGLAQLSVLEPFVPKEIKLLGITKGRKYKRKGGRLLDEFWKISRATGEVNKIKLSNKEILIDLRDEAHRFAIIHHRKARIKSGLQSEILHINGVGQKSKKKLLLKFKSINNLRKASFEDLNKVLNNRKISSEVFNHFRNNN
ncbi:MAG TPA: UvrB/UvrC motif-containing protein, partial [Candidatus Dojkabacteria bacterium]|nr:UvrB/UvrC motif-containing protein [Candidatus Dojkabacteria bacterium]